MSVQDRLDDAFETALKAADRFDDALAHVRKLVEGFSLSVSNRTNGYVKIELIPAGDKRVNENFSAPWGVADKLRKDSVKQRRLGDEAEDQEVVQFVVATRLENTKILWEIEMCREDPGNVTFILDDDARITAFSIDDIEPTFIRAAQQSSVARKVRSLAPIQSVHTSGAGGRSALNEGVSEAPEESSESVANEDDEHDD